MAQFTNQATLLYNGTPISSNLVTGEVAEVLTIRKAALNSCYSRNERITYIITITNTGTTPQTGITVTDNLGAYQFGTNTLYPLTYTANSLRYYQNGTLQTAPTVAGTAPLSVSGITVPANGNVTLIYSAAANEFAPPNAEAEITNTATLTGEGLTAISDTATLAACPKPELSITKFAAPAVVTENGRITYTFIIQNLGNTALTAEDAVQITDTFNPILSDLTVTFNGTDWTAGTDYTYDAATGLFQSAAGKIVVPAAAFAQDAATGAWSINPGVSTLVVSGTI